VTEASVLVPNTVSMIALSLFLAMAAPGSRNIASAESIAQIFITSSNGWAHFTSGMPGRRAGVQA
jgi:hypothetical protein